ncbi:uncharacterized protein LOC120067113 [Benincasa hispida]|uniref:uncharacterized protein LOC120067113 n=1 Tax=Benincasa hispida TaxID=102211 RepID=UPI00190274ED|nr:uncharacterized protein LOC120067113 [Benincasa hispida]
MHIDIVSKLSKITHRNSLLFFLSPFPFFTNTSHSLQSSSSCSSSSSIKPDAMPSQKMQTHTNNNQTIPQKQGVIITVYVESPKLQDNNSHKPPIIPHNNINNPNSALPKTPNSTGYDRRAQLLAYSRHLRNQNSSLSQSSKTESKKWKWRVRSEAPAVRRMPSRRALQRWRYERVGMMREETTEVVDQPCRPKCFGGKSSKKSTVKSGSSIFRKLKSLLGELSNGCKR